MGSIRIPHRYLQSDPVSQFHTISDKEERDPQFRFLLNFIGLGVENGKAVRTRRVSHSFIQIYSVQFVNSLEEELNQIHGTMVVDIFKIFDRQNDNCSHYDIDPHGFVRLRGPMCPLDAVSTIYFYPMVFRKDQPDDFFHPNQAWKFNKGFLIDRDVEVPSHEAKGYYGMWLCEERFIEQRCNQIMCDEMQTACGRLKLTYAIFDDAADCFLTIKLIQWKGKGEVANVYGTVQTSNTMLPDAKSLVFDRKRDEHESVQLGHYIVMDRPVTVVPIGHKLTVTVCLFHNGRGSDDDLVIARGTYSMKAKSTYEDLNQIQHRRFAQQKVTPLKKVVGITENKRFRGNLGKVEIKAYWMPCWCSSFHDQDEANYDEIK